MDDKVIVTNLSALRSKYGKGLSKIEAAVKRLIAADKKRGITTRFIALDDAPAMKKLKAPHVTNSGDFKQNKQAIDALFRSLMPDYLMILGANDIVPHQNLKNPLFNPINGDPDEFAYGDLPYACEAPYSQRPQDFTGPTRVLGRMPDLNGVADLDYLIRIIEVAAQYKQLKLSDYSSYLGISTEVWRGSTEMSLTNLFGSAKDLQLAPDKGPKWGASLISRRTHFINCHGAAADFRFYGQRGADYPQAHDASFFNGKIKEGTIAVAECCYGGELYNPNLADGQPGICNTYLGNKAYGYFGSTTIAYGPPEGNGSADLICQYFLKSVFKGASTGRAALEARQRFIESSPALDPVDLKTLAQFNLYGDPSIIPVAGESKKTRGATRGAKATLEAAATARADVRRQLLSKGLWLAENQPVAVERRVGATRGGRTRGGGTGAGGISSSIQAALKRLASNARLARAEVMSFGIERAPEPKSMTRSMKAMRPPSTAFHVIVGRAADGEATTGSTTRGGTRGVARTRLAAAAKQPPVSTVVTLVAKEVDGQIVAVRELHAK